MASRRVMLVGHTSGPWVNVSRVPEPILKIRGLPHGAKVELRTVDDKGSIEVAQYDSDGEYSIQPSPWARADCVGATRCSSLICEILSQRSRNAVLGN